MKSRSTTVPGAATTLWTAPQTVVFGANGQLSSINGAAVGTGTTSLAIDTPDGIVLIVGCSHPTIEKIVEAAKNVINKPIHLVLGGLHLLPQRTTKSPA